jgi:hypothetical protein
MVIEKEKRVTNQDKARSILALAKQKFQPKDIIDTTMSSISIIKGIMTVKVNKVNASLSLDEALTFSKYLGKHRDKIMENQSIVFLGKSGLYTLIGIQRALKAHLRDYAPDITMESLGWNTTATTRVPEQPITSLEDIERVLEMFKTKTKE